MKTRRSVFAVRAAVAAFVFGGCATGAGQPAETFIEEVAVAAYHYLISDVFRGDPHGVRPFCFLYHPDDSFERPPRGAGIDPPVGVMVELQRNYPTARRGSECAIDYAVPGDPRVEAADRPIIYRVGQVILRRRGEAEVAVGYHFHGLNAAGRRCTARRAAAGWRITSCESGWVS